MLLKYRRLLTQMSYQRLRRDIWHAGVVNTGCCTRGCKPLLWHCSMLLCFLTNLLTKHGAFVHIIWFSCSQASITFNRSMASYNISSSGVTVSISIMNNIILLFINRAAGAIALGLGKALPFLAQWKSRSGSRTFQGRGIFCAITGSGYEFRPWSKWSKIVPRTPRLLFPSCLLPLF